MDRRTSNLNFFNDETCSSTPPLRPYFRSRYQSTEAISDYHVLLLDIVKHTLAIIEERIFDKNPEAMQDRELTRHENQLHSVEGSTSHLFGKDCKRHQSLVFLLKDTYHLKNRQNKNHL